MGSSTKTTTIFKQWQKLPPGNSGCSFQTYIYDLEKRKGHLKLTKQAHSSHLGNISTTRHRAGSNTSQSTPHATTCTYSGHAAGSLPDVAHGQSILSSVHRATLSPCRPQEQRFGPALATGSVPPQSLGAPGSEACACTYAYVQTTAMLGQPEFENRLRHVCNSWSRQILRRFLKIVPLLLWHSCLELAVSSPIYKPPFSWRS